MPSSRLIVAALIVAALAVAYRLVLLVERVNDTQPGSGGYWFIGLVVWGGVGFLIANYAEKRCREKKWTRNCYLEWKGAAGIYAFVTAVTFILIRELIRK